VQFVCSCRARLQISRVHVTPGVLHCQPAPNQQPRKNVSRLKQDCTIYKRTIFYFILLNYLNWSASNITYDFYIGVHRMYSSVLKKSELWVNSYVSESRYTRILNNLRHPF
jgi:hypothetical protein